MRLLLLPGSDAGAAAVMLSILGAGCAVGLSITGVIAAAVELSISDAICCSGDDERVLVMSSISDAIAAAVGMSISDASAAAALMGARAAEHLG